jgi:serine/threonine protein kinase
MQGLKRIAAFKKAKFIQRKKKLEQKRLLEESNSKVEKEDDQLSTGNLSTSGDDQVDLVAKLINKRYLVLKFLGSGSYSRVWMAHDFTDKKYVALKIFNPEDYDDSEDEIKMMNLMGNNNEYIVKMYDNFDYYPENSNYKLKCIVYELLGISVLDMLSPYENKLSLENVKKLVSKILVAMDQYYKKDIIHNDVKLENMMTKYFPDELVDYIAWFNQLDVDEEYKNLVSQNLPDGYDNLSDEKKKKIRRKIKHKILPNYVDTIKNTILQHLNPTNNALPDTTLETTTLEDTTLEDTTLETTTLEDTTLEDTTQEDTNVLETTTLEDTTLDDTTLDDTTLDDTTLDDTNVLETTMIPDEDLLREIEELNDSFSKLLTPLSIVFNDFGNACHVNDKYDDKIQHRSYRPPENVIGNGFCKESDIWSLGCIIYEIITDKVLFNVVGNREIDRDRNHLSLMYQVIGQMPEKMTDECEQTNELFGRNARILQHDEINYSSLEAEIMKHRADLTEENIKDVADFLRLMLRYNPYERLSPSELLQQKWLKENSEMALHTIMSN